MTDRVVERHLDARARPSAAASSSAAALGSRAGEVAGALALGDDPRRAARASVVEPLARAAARPASCSARAQSSIQSAQSLSPTEASIRAASLLGGVVETARGGRRASAAKVSSSAISASASSCVAGVEPVEDARGARPGALGDVGDPRRGEAALGDHLAAAASICGLRMWSICGPRAHRRRRLRVSLLLTVPTSPRKAEPPFRNYPWRRRAQVPTARRPSRSDQPSRAAARPELGRERRRRAARAASTSIAGSRSSARTPVPSSSAIARSAARSTSSVGRELAALRPRPRSPPTSTRGSARRAGGDRLAGPASRTARSQSSTQSIQSRSAAARQRQAFVDRQAEPLGRRRPRPPARREALVARLSRRSGSAPLEQLLAGREVVVDERGRGAGPHRRPGRSGRRRSRPRDQLAGGLEDPLAGVPGPWRPR